MENKTPATILREQIEGFNEDYKTLLMREEHQLKELTETVDAKNGTYIVIKALEEALRRLEDPNAY